MTDNMQLWNKVCKTDPKHTKPTTLNNRKITAIDPQYQRMCATEQFGPFGIGWGVIDESWSYMDFPNQTKLGTYSAKLWYKLGGEGGELPITSNIKIAYVTNGGKGYLMIDDEYAKKAQTDAITKGLSALGFNADVFMGLYDDNKYVQQMREEFGEPKQIAESKQIDEIAQGWIDYCKNDPSKLNEIQDKNYRDFIAQQIGLK